MSTDSLHYENVGLFIGLLSYPYYQDGKILYGKLETFFAKHKEQIWSFEPCDRNDEVLYQPSGYRMFGSHGLAVLSLVDDYTFYNRHFNKNHIQTVLDDCEKEQSNKEGEKKEEEELDFNSTVISGASETEGTSLTAKARNTFLREESNRFHYIGIIRLKINHDFLLEEKGHKGGIQVLRDIKYYIEGVLKKKCKIEEYIAVDCFDNDEMTIIAFSDVLLSLYNFLGEIRSITNEHIGIECEEQDEENKTNKTVEKHMFGSALLCFGYDVKFDPTQDPSISGFTMKCLMETKAGHRDSLFKYLHNNKKAFGIQKLSKNITGGCSLIAEFPMNTIKQLEKMCREDITVLRDVRKMKVVLSDSEKGNRIKRYVKDNHISFTNNKVFRFDEEFLRQTKALMKEVGLSKLVRDRLMALYELYNNSCQNILQRCYLEELKPTMKSFPSMIKGMRGRKERITDIEKTLNVEISNMENAIYDRLHPQKHNQPPLEYSGGIQQHLTTFDYAYKYISRVFSPKETIGYVTITGAERASSARFLFNLNINDIIFPELFITTAWKEVANFAIKLIESPPEKTNVDAYAKGFFADLDIWQQFSQNDESFNIIRNGIFHSDVIMSKDKTSEIAMKLMNRELLMYFFKDYIVFHFAFLKDYQMMWYYYLKTMLQTTICYNELNVIDRKHFVHMMMRLFMVGLLSDDESDRDFIKEQASLPFDHLLGDLWIKDYEKTHRIAATVFDNLEQYGFKKMNDEFIHFKEQNIKALSFETDIAIEIKDRIKKRKDRISLMVEAFNQGRLVDSAENDHKDYIICLFYAYLKALCDLDNSDRPIKSIPRDSGGTVVEFSKEEKGAFLENAINILVDPTGGFFVPSSENRNQYFLLRTVLYRSLWNYRFTNTSSLS